MGVLAGLAVFWGAAEWPALVETRGVFAWRNLLIQFTGVLAMGAMGMAMLLSMRPRWLERRLHGLDKMYRLHKWLGIGGLVFAVLHWLAVQAPKWLVQAGLLQRPARGPRQLHEGAVLQFLQGQRGLAEELGEKAFYLAVLLVALALIKRFPYRHFLKTHRWMAPVYLVLVFHAIVLTSFDYWPQAVGWAGALLMAAGSVAALLSITGRIAHGRRVVGEVAELVSLPGVQVNAITVMLKDAWPGHEAGQFAFVSFDAREGAHPFTISSAWQGDGRLQFIVRALGDYTRTLDTTLRIGDTVVVEGPYGRFNFEGSAQRQIWIGAGIGVTPFVARMKALAAAPDGRRIDLIHATREVDEQALDLLAADARAAGVKLHLILSARDGRLDGERLRQMVPDWAQADVWFCGPSGFGHALRDDLVAHGLPRDRFQQELFEMR